MGFSLLVYGMMLFQTPGQQQTPPQQPAAQQDQEPKRNGIVLRLEESIKGKENLPAEQVWKNIKLFKGEPAIKVLRVMEYAFGPGLGVRCNYCHEPGKWEEDSKDHKEIARQMWAMQSELSRTIKKITGKEDAAVNCTTCHRGDTKPALNLTPRQRSEG